MKTNENTRKKLRRYTIRPLINPLFCCALLVMLSSFSTSEAQVHEWSYSIGGSNFDLARGIAVDQGLASSIVGQFTETVDMDPSASSATVFTSMGEGDGFLAHYDQNGALKWARQAGSSGQDEMTAVAIDGQDYTLVVGYFSGDISFPAYTGNWELTSVGEADIFFAQFDQNGYCRWAKSVGGSAFDASSGIAVDAQGNVFLTGFFKGVVDFDPGTGQALLTQTGGINTSDLFLAKYDNNGNYQWATKIGGNASEDPREVATDLAGNVYVCGNFRGNIQLSGQISLQSAGDTDAFFAKYAPDGQLLWAKNIGGTSVDDIRAISANENGDVYISGIFWDQTRLDGTNTQGIKNSNGAYDVFFAQYSTNGVYQWGKSIGGSSSESLYDLKLDAQSNLYLTGSFGSSMDIDPDAGQQIINPIGSGDIFFCKYDAEGILKWGHGLGGSSTDEGHSIAIDQQNNVYLTGIFKNSANMDPQGAANSLLSAGEFDVFFAKYRQKCTPLVTTTADNGPGSLRYAISEACAGDVIRFDLRYGSVIELTSGSLKIEKDLTIEGPGANWLSITPNGQTRIFYIKEGAKVKIQKLSMSDGSTELTGGAILNGGHLTLEACTLSENITVQGIGGAIANDGYLMATDCIFEQNKAGNGGAIYNSSGNQVELFNCTFTSNTALTYGGAIRNASGGILQMEDCVFEQDSATYGGAISTEGVFEAIGSQFSTNYATKDGGAIHAIRNGNQVKMDSCIISRNRVGERGAGLYIFGSNMEMTACVVDSNTIDNLASTTEGGGFYIYGGEIVIRQSTISNNEVHDGLVSASGGGIYNQWAILTLENTTISQNTASGRGNGHGGGIYNDDKGKLNLLYTTITKNRGAAQNPFGGGIYNKGQLQMGHSILLANRLSIPSDGPEGYNEGGTLISNGYNLVGSNAGFGFPAKATDIVDYVGEVLGPLQNNGGFTYTHALLNCENPALDGGSPLTTYRIDQRGFPRPVNNISDIGAYEFGGTVDTYIVTSKADAGPASLREVIASACEGALITFSPALANDSIVLTSGEILITKALTIQGLGAEQLTLSGNRNSRIFRIEGVEKGLVSIQGLTLKRGSAVDAAYHRDQGGAIYNADSLVLEACILRENNMSTSSRIVKGGAVYNTGSLTVKQCEISDNKLGSYTISTLGGGIYNTASLSIEGSWFERNWTGGPGSGGAIYHESGSLYLINTAVIDNFAGAPPVKTGGLGGGLFIGEGTVEILSSTFSQNLSQGGGGAILNQGGTLLILNSTISNNEAYHGGGIENGTQGSMSVHYSTIVRNFAEQKERGLPYGGGIRNEGQLSIANSLVADNIRGPSQTPDGQIPGGPSDIVGAGPVNSQGYNLIGANTNGITPNNGDLFGSFEAPLAAMLADLLDNGGLTYTHALLTGSPAIDAANPNESPDTDQRGQVRPFGGRADIGAYEAQIAPPDCETNIALNRPVVASSIENNDHLALYAVDGNTNTRWASQWSDPQWIYVDLGSTYQICQLILRWETAYGKAYQIEVSDDASSWTSILSVSNNTSKTNVWSNLTGSGRYVRMYGTERATPWGYSLFEFEVYGYQQQVPNEPPVLSDANFGVNPYSPTATPVGTLSAEDANGDNLSYSILSGNTDNAFAVNASSGLLSVNNSQALSPGRAFSLEVAATDDGPGNLSGTATINISVSPGAGNCETNLALNRPAVASSEEDDSFGLLPATYAVDGDPNTRWSSEWSDPQWIYVDLGNKYELCKVVLKWEQAYARDFQIDVSDDAQNWTNIHTVIDNNSQDNTFENLNGRGRYVRIYGTRRASQYGYSLYEFEVYGRDLVANRPPVVIASTFEIDPYSPNGSFVGQVLASDPDGDNLSYGFVGANDGGLIINTSTGEIRVFDSSIMTPGRVLTRLLRVTDDGPGNLSTEETITIRVRDLVADCETNLALNRPAVASSQENSGLPASAAVDGKLGTRWSSEWSDPQWIYVDLGSKYDLCKVVLRWETAFGRDFQIQVSDNPAQGWVAIHTLYGNNSKTNTIDNLSASGRYVRIYGVQRATQWGYSLYEFEVYGQSSSSRLGREYAAANPELNIFPNPAHEYLNVSFSSSVAGPAQLRIYSLQGQKLLTYEQEAVLGHNQFRLELNTLPAGSYLLRLSHAQFNESKRLLIVK